VSFTELVKMMVDSDLRLAEAEQRSGLHAHRSREG
jgi:hypothetical protein